MDRGVAGVDVEGCGVAAGWGGVARGAAGVGCAGGDDAAGLYRRALEARNLHVVAELIVAAALGREESRGAHYRNDFPLRRECGAALGDGEGRAAVCGLGWRLEQD